VNADVFRFDVTSLDHHLNTRRDRALRYLAACDPRRERHGARTRNPLDHRQRIDDVFGEPIDEVRVLFGTHVFSRAITATIFLPSWVSVRSESVPLGAGATGRFALGKAGIVTSSNTALTSVCARMPILAAAVGMHFHIICAIGSGRSLSCPEDSRRTHESCAAAIAKTESPSKRRWRRRSSRTSSRRAHRCLPARRYHAHPRLAPVPCRPAFRRACLACV